ncbi:MAG: glycosyltransferase [Thermoplasmatales archaeon]|nr:glycosyltransferase [Thermoplasmatales archaeon]
MDEFAENTIKLLRDDKRRREVGERGYKYAKKNHDWSGIAQRLEEMLIYEVQSREQQSF